MDTNTMPATGASTGGAKPQSKTTNPPAHPKDDALRIPVREQPPLQDMRPMPNLAEMDDRQFATIQEQLEHEAYERAPETRGDRLFQELFREQDMLVRKQVSLAKDAVRLISGALTAFVDRKDPKAKVRQDDGPYVNHARERVEMTTIVRSLRFVRGKYTVWAELDGDDARCGIVIRRRWRDPVHLTADEFPHLLEKMAWYFSLAAR